MSGPRPVFAALLALAVTMHGCAPRPDAAAPADAGARADSTRPERDPAARADSTRAGGDPAAEADSTRASEDSTAVAEPVPARADAAAAGGECATGTVILEGVRFAPRTWARSATGAYVELTGPLVANVRLLSGTTVRVCGPAATPDGALEVREVELLEVDRMPAVLGTLRETATRWAVEPLAGGEPVRLRDVPEAFADAVGEIVWVAGELGADGLAVRSYGVLEGWR